MKDYIELKLGKIKRLFYTGIAFIDIMVDDSTLFEAIKKEKSVRNPLVFGKKEHHPYCISMIQVKNKDVNETIKYINMAHTKALLLGHTKLEYYKNKLEQMIETEFRGL